MMFVNNGKEMVAYRMGSDVSIPTHIGVGVGSETVTTSTSGLSTTWDRNAFTGSTDLSVLKHFKFSADFSSVEMSGCLLKELGVFDIVSGGKLWSKDVFKSITFNGGNEFIVSYDWEVF